MLVKNKDFLIINKIHLQHSTHKQSTEIVVKLEEVRFDRVKPCTSYTCRQVRKWFGDILFSNRKRGSGDTEKRESGALSLDNIQVSVWKHHSNMSLTKYNEL